jgi:hypothetical protein
MDSVREIRRSKRGRGPSGLEQPLLGEADDTAAGDDQVIPNPDVYERQPPQFFLRCPINCWTIDAGLCRNVVMA